MDEIEGLFPVPLLHAHTLLDPTLIAALAAQIADSHAAVNSRSDRLSHTEIVRPGTNDLYRQLAQAAGPKIVEFGALLFGDRLRWAIKEMWTNVLETGGSQSLHAHANSFVSGIVYLTPSHPSAHTVFVRNPGGSEFTFRHNTRTSEIGPFNAGKWITPSIEPGDMLLFPSYLLHEVPRNEGGRRITLAFKRDPGPPRQLGIQRELRAMRRWALLLMMLAGHAAAQTAGPPRLTGVVLTPERRVAMFEDASGATEAAEEGALVFGYLVRSIRRDQTILERDGRALMLVPTPAGTTAARLPADTGGVTFGLIVNPQRPAED